MAIRQPDIVLLVLDTQRADRLSCYGHTRETSPHLDALAADATHFPYAFSTAQWTMPSHASMFTGLYPSSHNTLQTRAVLPATLPTLAERLRDGGYYTAAFCNNPLVGVVNNGLRRGFYSFLNYSGLLTSRPNQAGVQRGLIDRYRQVFKRLLAGWITRMQDAFARSEALFAFSMTPLMVPLWQTALSFKGNTVRSLKDAARLLVERKGVATGQPIFAFINLMGTHTPYNPPRRFVERFAPQLLRDRKARRYLQHFNSDIYGWLAPLAGPIDAERKATLDAIYDAEVANQDEQLGAFFGKLHASGALDRTLLMVCADHGDHLGEKQLIGHCFSAYNELVRVPLLIRDPAGDLPRGATAAHVVSTRRIFHTALEAAGLATEAERSLTLARSSAADPDGGAVFAEAVPLQNVLSLVQKRQPELVRDRGVDQAARAVWSGQYKLIQTGDARLEMYNVFADPDETHNLIDALPEQAVALQQRLHSFVARTGDSAPAAETAPEDDDELVRRRLHDLGYLE